MLLAAVLGAAAIAAPSGDPPPAPDRFNPVPSTTLTLTHARMKPMQRHWETDDDSFYGWPTSRHEAVRMTAIVDEVLRSGPYHGAG